jgi:hypothetical protein
VKLSDNPIFITQKRLVHRGGVMAAVLIAGLVGFCLLLGLVETISPDPHSFRQSPQELGKLFYGWIVGIEILILVIGAFGRISCILGEERKAGLWDSNRLTPLKASEIVTGYWLGPALREFYMAAVLAGFGLIITLAGQLSPALWLGTQLLIVSTSLFFGLLAVLTGMAFQKQQSALVFLPIIFAWPLAFIAPGRMLTNFLLPIHGLVHLFRVDSGDRDWNASPEFFSLPIPSILYTLAIQIIIGWFIWRVAVRKTANPFQPLLLRWEAVAIFGILLAAQHGLIWSTWRGEFPAETNSDRYSENAPMLFVTHCGTILLAIIFLGLASPQPESVRVKALRLGVKNSGAVFWESAVSLALALAGVSAIFLLTQCAGSFSDSWEIFLVAAGNLLTIFLVFALLLELCRLQFRRRALGFVALLLFVVCALPFILAAVFGSEAIAKLSLLSPGAFALADSRNQDLNNLLGIVVAHFGIAALLFIGWQRRWKQLLAKAV